MSFVHKADGEDSQAVLDRTLDTAKCIYLDRARQRRCPPLTPEQGAERKAAFGAWTAKVGEGSSTSATHFGTSASVRDDDSEGTARDLIGDTIVEGHDLAAAKALTDGLPFLSRNGKCATEVFELLPM